MSGAQDVELLLQKEKEGFKREVEGLRAEIAALQVVLEEQRMSFRELITRVTNLRMAKGERVASRLRDAASAETHGKSNTAVEGSFAKVRQLLDSYGPVVRKVFSQLGQAARDAVADNASGVRGLLLPFFGLGGAAAAKRTTGVVLVSRNELRSVRSWAKQHLKACAQCLERVTGGATMEWWVLPLLGEAVGKGTSMKGLAAAMSATPALGKERYHASLQLREERVLTEQEEEQPVDILRASGEFEVGDGGTAVAAGGREKAAAVAKHVNQVMAQWLEQDFSRLRQKLQDWASSSLGATGGAHNGGAANAALELILHKIAPRAEARAIGATTVRIDLSVAVPKHVAFLAPSLLSFFDTAEQRDYIAKHLILPVATQIGAALGMADIVSHYMDVAFHACEELYRTLNRGSDAGVVPSSSSPADAVMPHVYAILHALAVFETRTEICIDVPALVTSTTSVSSAAQPLRSAKLVALRLAKALLRNFMVPSPYVFPPPNDAAAMDWSCRLERAPTSFLEILNQSFTSNQRLPSTSRNSVLDAVVSPRSKISIALKFFSELCVEVYRPYGTATGVVVAQEEGIEGRLRAAPCVPVVAMPPDLISSNIAVGEKTNSFIKSLEDMERATMEAGSALTPAERLAEELVRQEGTVQALGRELQCLGVDLARTHSLSMAIALPFSASELNAQSTARPLFYLHIEGRRAS